MTYAITIAIIVFIWIIVILKKGNLGFWNCARKHPQAALLFFKQNPDVFAIQGLSSDSIDRKHYDVGPFLVAFMGQTFKVYANQQGLKDKEREFVAKIKSLNGTK